MAINVPDSNRKDQYIATAAQTVFPYTFPIFDEEDIGVSKDGVTLTLTTDYTVSGVSVESGGNITLIVAATGGEIITIFGDSVIEREDQNFQQSGDFLADDLNRQLNEQTIFSQELNTKLDSKFGVSISSTYTGSLDLPEAVANALIGWNATEDALENKTTADGYPLPTPTSNTMIYGTGTAWGTLNPDNSTIEIDTATLQVKDSGITTVKINDDAITADKLADTAVISGSYTNTNLTVDDQGRITSASSGSSSIGVFHVRDEKTSGTQGGTSISGTQTRDLQTEEANTITGAVLNGDDTFDLPAGKYVLNASANANKCDNHRLSLYNNTASTTQCFGTVEFSNDSDSVSCRSFVTCYLDLSVTTEFEIKHYTEVALSSTGLGVASDDGNPEIYTDVFVTKIG